MTKRLIIIPVEIKHREFLAKFALALSLIKNTDVIIGNQKTIINNFHLLPPSVYFDKSIASTKYSYFKRLKNLGIKIVCSCEEGLVYRNTNAYLSQRISKNTFSLIQKFFLWGSNQYYDVKKILLPQKKLIMAGNPRIDILDQSYKFIWVKESTAIRKLYKNFILINTNFSIANNYNSAVSLKKKLKKRGTLKSELIDATYYDEWIKYTEKIFEHFISMIKYLSVKNPNINILVRPHINENLRKWKKLLKGYKNVFITNDDSVVPYILASKCVIHNSCTTSIESYYLGKNVITYKPLINDNFDSKLPNLLGKSAFTVRDVDNFVKLSLQNKKFFVSQKSKKILSEYIHSEESIKIITNELSKIKIDKNGIKVKAYKLIYSVIANIKKFKNLLIGDKKIKKLQANKFDKLDINEIKDLLRLYKNNNVVVKKFSNLNDVFLIHNND